MVQQKTLRRKVECRGIGLHGAQPVRLSILPSRRDSGITFVRTDLGGASLRLRKARIVRADHATTLSGREVTVSTVEHLLAALRIMGIDNAIVELDAPEVPILDGSAAPFVYLIREAGIRRQAALRRYLVPRRPIEIQEDGREILLEPCDRLRISYLIDFPGTWIGRQVFSRTLHQKALVDEIAPARTFCFLRDVPALRERGLALGGSLDNAVVVDETGPMNPVRFPDEFVRHKVLDLIGDLSLLGAPVVGRISVSRGGHALHARLIEAMRQPGAMEVVIGTAVGGVEMQPAAAAT